MHCSLTLRLVMVGSIIDIPTSMLYQISSKKVPHRTVVKSRRPRHRFEHNHTFCIAGLFATVTIVRCLWLFHLRNVPQLICLVACHEKKYKPMVYCKKPLIKMAIFPLRMKHEQEIAIFHPTVFMFHSLAFFRRTPPDPPGGREGF